LPDKDVHQSNRVKRADRSLRGGAHSCVTTHRTIAGHRTCSLPGQLASTGSIASSFVRWPAETRLDRRTKIRARWSARQIKAACPWKRGPRYLIAIGIRCYGRAVQHGAAHGHRDKPIATRLALPETSFAERLSGSDRRGCVQPMIVWRAHLLRNSASLCPHHRFCEARTECELRIRVNLQSGSHRLAGVVRATTTAPTWPWQPGKGGSRGRAALVGPGRSHSLLSGECSDTF